MNSVNMVEPIVLVGVKKTIHAYFLNGIFLIGLCVYVYIYNLDVE